MAQYGAYMEEGGMEQVAGILGIQNTVIDASSHHPSIPFCTVDLLTDGTTLTAHLQLHATTATLPLLLPVPLFAGTPLSKWSRQLWQTSNSPQRRRLCEVLASTACPVRGPAPLQA
jgi:hypothetical protein